MAAAVPPVPPGWEVNGAGQQGIAADQLNRELLAELKAVRQLLERLLAAAQPGSSPERPVEINAQRGHALGRFDAPITVVEFGDLECPFCRQYFATTFATIKAGWIDTGKVRYIVRDFPIVQLHPAAFVAARAARCADRGSKFWEMRTLLLRSPALTTQVFLDAANQLKLDRSGFEQCLGSSEVDGDIQREMNEGIQLGVRATPTFVIGRSSGDRVDGVMVVGALSYQAFEAILKRFEKASGGGLPQ